MQVVLISRQLEYFRNGCALSPVYAKLLRQLLQVECRRLTDCIHYIATDVTSAVRIK